MTLNDKLVLKRNRLAYLQSNGKNIDSPGVVKKLVREIRSLENKTQ